MCAITSVLLDVRNTEGWDDDFRSIGVLVKALLSDFLIWKILSFWVFFKYYLWWLLPSGFLWCLLFRFVSRKINYWNIIHFLESWINIWYCVQWRCIIQRWCKSWKNCTKQLFVLCISNWGLHLFITSIKKIMVLHFMSLFVLKFYEIEKPKTWYYTSNIWNEKLQNLFYVIWNNIFLMPLKGQFCNQ